MSVLGAFGDEEGFVSIFNGKDLSGWEGDKEHYYADGGLLKCRQEGRFGGGNLWTARDYQNFHLKFEFKQPRETNNGLSIRCRPGASAATEGMEIQILDDTAPYYWSELKLKPYQYHGSIYGVVPAKRRPGFDGPDAPAKSTYLRPVGEWNEEEVIADGHHITVILNGETIVDADVSKFRGDGDTPDHRTHPGLHSLNGRIGWCGHGYNVEWRNIRVRELPPSPTVVKGGRWAFDAVDANGRTIALWIGNGVYPNENGWSVLWGSGSPVAEEPELEADGTVVFRKEYRYDNPDWNVTRELRFRPTNAEKVECSYLDVHGEGATAKKFCDFRGEAMRIPVLSRPPVIHQLFYEGEWIDLLKGGLGGWKSMNPDKPFFWTVKDGVLENRCDRDEKGKVVHGANIVTLRDDFENFKLVYDVKVPKGCNSGVYLKGIYEIQTLDSRDKPLDCHNMAAPYGRITPTFAAEQWADHWQHVEVILCDRYITVTLNDVKIVDNQPLLGVTGGAITANEFVPGPIYIQGDHSDAAYRNMFLRKIVKRRPDTETRTKHPQISVFITPIRKYAQMHGISIAESAEIFHRAGVTGFDINYAHEEMDTYMKTCLRPSNFYGSVNFLEPAEGEKDMDAFLGAAKKYGVPRVMVIPREFTSEDETVREREIALTAEGLRKMVAKGRTMGIKVMIEPYGGPTNPCSYLKYLRRLLTEVPDARFAFDVGNLVHVGRGEDVRELKDLVRDRVEHIHLKDSPAADPEGGRLRVTIGTGVSPNADIVRWASANGYAGFYTLENLVGDPLEDTIRQIAVIRHWIGDR